MAQSNHDSSAVMDPSSLRFWKQRAICLMGCSRRALKYTVPDTTQPFCAYPFRTFPLATSPALCATSCRRWHSVNPPWLSPAYHGGLVQRGYRGKLCLSQPGDVSYRALTANCFANRQYNFIIFGSGVRMTANHKVIIYENSLN